ncbi:hypothetical protein [Seonamhaeicola marinus]|uniref:Uncharacterized protein n=1 Tax=Seonamhaeicola marinus TaxID=1912246 RepID=A0A5D0HUD7_9FLAO|nr:hypothetical protein [Seonamhaeicola marinus]TYA74984.1 hypothetical protein FUA24_16930 [Seonamhaeicola marinus]
MITRFAFEIVLGLLIVISLFFIVLIFKKTLSIKKRAKSNYANYKIKLSSAEKRKKVLYNKELLSKDLSQSLFSKSFSILDWLISIHKSK